MRCQICCKRKAVHSVEDYGVTLNICEKCRRSSYPTDIENAHDDEQEQYRAERQAEYDAETAYQSNYDYM